MPSNIVALTSGVCTSINCSSTNRGKRSVRSIQDIINNSTNVSNETAASICDTYIQTFLNNASHTPASRDDHYNATISSARDMCIYDVTNFGAAVSSPNIYYALKKWVSQSNFLCTSLLHHLYLQSQHDIIDLDA